MEILGRLLEQYGGYGLLIVIIGFFLNRLVTQQDKLISAMTGLNDTLLQLQGDVRLYKSHNEVNTKDIDCLKQEMKDVEDDVHDHTTRISYLEKDHAARTKNAKDDTCSGR